MPSTYTGNDAAVTAHQVPAISSAVDSDPFGAETINTPDQRLADIAAFLQKYAALIGKPNPSGVLEVEQLKVDSGVEILGAISKVGSISHPVIAALPAYYQLTDEYLGLAGSPAMRRYIYPTGRVADVVNASFQDGEWVRDVAGQHAFMVETTVGSVTVKFWPAADSTPWLHSLQLSHNGVKFLGTGSPSDANPAATEALSNELRAKNICKAWGALHFSGPSTGTVNDGFNIASVTAVSGNIRVTFAAPMANTNYAVNVRFDNTSNPAHGAAFLLQPEIAKSLGYFEMTLRDNNQDLIALSSFSRDFDVTVFGAQTT